MAKITYLLGAGASYNACPILEKQAEMMINVASAEIDRLKFSPDRNGLFSKIDFENIYDLNKFQNSEYKILWYMYNFGIKAKEYNTIDTYARKLYLNKEFKEYKLLKMCVSVFFDLWENFYHSKFNLKEKIPFKKIDDRYKSLFSVLLENENDKIKLNSNFKFITWNYDLQLIETFRLFLGNHLFRNLNSINSNNLKFKREDKSINNDVFHLNGHRGFFKDILDNDEKEIVLNYSNSLDVYWGNLQNLFQATILNNAKFDNYINYAWEHDLSDDFFKNISKVLNETEILIIIGYSFPAFNRKIDQFLFKHLNCNVLKKIIYQDPNADKEMIINLFEDIYCYEEVDIKILTDEKSLKQFYLPNEHFLIQNNGPSGVDPKVF